MRKKQEQYSKGTGGTKGKLQSASEQSVAKGGAYDSTRCAPNDPSWYAANPQLLKDAASYSFNNPLGNKLSLYSGTAGGAFSVPGVYSIRCVAVPGKSLDNNSPVNVAARNIYSFVRHANSGHSNYESSDLMLYLLAMDQLYSILAFMTRAYGVMGTYNQTNRYMPEALMTSMRLDFSDFMSRLADFRYFINSCAVKIGSMCVPKSMSYFTRHMWMYTNVYKDSESSKAGLYLYNPHMFYKFSPTSSEQGGELIPELWAGSGTGSKSLLTVSELMDKVNSFIQPILTDEDMNIMSGDILKAFGAEGVFKVGPVPEDYAVFPVHNYEVLNQMNNATLVSTNFDLSNWKITQSTAAPTAGAVIFNPVWNIGKGLRDAWYLPCIFNSYHESPDPSEVMVGSRLSVVGTTASSATTFSLHSCGSEIAVAGEIYSFVLGAGNAWTVETPSQLNQLTKYDFRESSDVSSVILSYGVLADLAKQENFDWHPQVFVVPYQGSEEASNLRIQLPFVDLDNYTLLYNTDLEKLHETALLSEFSVPQMGSWNNKLS